MKIRASQWYEVKVRASESTEDGTEKDKTIPYVVEAFSFAEAEDIAIQEASSFHSGHIDIVDIKKGRYVEVFFSDNTADDRWFKTTLQYIIINEKSGKEKRVNAYHLVQAATLQRAVKNIEEVMKGSMQDYTIASIIETAFMDVIIKAPVTQNNDNE